MPESAALRTVYLVCCNDTLINKGGSKWKCKVYAHIYEGVEMAEVFAKSEVKVWECRNCGHIVVGTAAPDACSTCNHPQSYFELNCENY